MTLPQQIKDLLANLDAIGKTVQISGWVRTRRDSKAGFSFINLHDGSCFAGIQIVADQSLDNYKSQILQLSVGCSIRVAGRLLASQGKGQSVEIQAERVTVLGHVVDPEHYPIAKKRHSFEYLRTVAHLRPRTNTFGAMTRIRHRCALAIHQYFHTQHFYWINTPIITTSDSEGAGELFRVSTLDLLNPPRSAQGQVNFAEDFFGEQTYLTVSGQLNAEAYCLAMSRVYTFGPTFRAENSNTSRHLAEFWMVEPEIAFADLNQLADLAEDFLKYVINALLDDCLEDLEFFNQRIDKTLLQRLQQIVESPFERMDYAAAIKILQKASQRFEYPVQWGLDLQSEHERYIVEQELGRPVIMMNYPQKIKAFYMRQNDDAKTVAAMDVLVPGIGEIIGGSQREERLEILQEKLAKMAVAESLDWYLDLRRYGTVPHAGFGLGFERLVTYVTGMENIRDISPFPRVPGSAPY